MIKVYPKKIDPERVKRQLDKLVSAFLDAAEEMIEKESHAPKAADAAPTHPTGLTKPLTLNSKTR